MSEPGPSNEANGINRRSFLKIATAGAAGIALTSLAEPYLVGKIRTWLSSSESTETESANKVSFRKDTVLMVNGKAEFPLGLYYLPGSDVASASQKTAEAGFNLVSQGWMNDKTIAEAEKNHLYTMAYLPYTFQNINNGQIDKGVTQKLRRSTSSLGYYGADEPDITLSRNLFVKSLQQIEKIDPDHPDMTVFAERPDMPDLPPFDITEFKKNYKGNPDDLTDLPDSITIDDFKAWYIKKSGTEIISFDYYDPNKTDSDTLGVGEITKKYVQDLRAGKFGPNAKAVWVTLSAHSEVPRTLKNMRFQAIDVVANGATGILWWDWPEGCTTKNCPGYPDKGNGYSGHWQDLTTITSELNSIKDSLTAREVFLGKNETGTIAYKITETTQFKRCIFAASKVLVQEAKPEKIQTFLPNTSFQVIGENRELITDKDGNLIDNFGSLDAHIYVRK
jgi:hypothetical protein